jgi:hypothetical protein
MPWDTRRGTDSFRTETSLKLEKEEGLKSERHLASLHEVSMQSLASYRRGHLRENYHWVLRNSTVYYTADGVKEVARHLEVLESEPEPTETDSHRIWFGPPPSCPLSADIIEVVKIPPNPRLLNCVDHEGHPVTIRALRSNRNFKKGMKIDISVQCRPNWDISYQLHNDHRRRIYDFIGRLPRTYGRW